MGALLVPCAVGALAGYLLGVSAIAYWGLQALAALGGLLGGLEHEGPSAAAGRGLIGGMLFASSLLLTHGLLGNDPAPELGSAPGFVVVVDGVVGAALGATGGSLRRRWEPAR